VQVTRLPLPPGIRFVVATPRVSLTTRAARRVLPAQVSLAQYSEGCARAAVVAAAIAVGDAEALGRAVEGGFLEERRGPLIAGYAGVCAAARRSGAAGVMISGAGPSVAAVVGPRGDAGAIARAMCAAFEAAGHGAAAVVARPAPGARLCFPRTGRGR
jgi:homoserine kinase